MLQMKTALDGLLLAAYIAHVRVLGTWSLSAADSAALAQGIVPQVTRAHLMSKSVASD